MMISQRRKTKGENRTQGQPFPGPGGAAFQTKRVVQECAIFGMVSECKEVDVCKTTPSDDCDSPIENSPTDDCGSARSCKPSPSKPTEEQTCPNEEARITVKACTGASTDNVVCTDANTTTDNGHNAEKFIISDTHDAEKSHKNTTEDINSAVEGLNKQMCGEASNEQCPTSSADSAAADCTESGEMLTDQVLEEEKKAEQVDEEEAKKESEELKKRKELWSRMDDETKEERYERLQRLLNRSNLYTEYLVKRMERQKEDEKKKREKLLKKAAKLEEQQPQKKDLGKMDVDMTTNAGLDKDDKENMSQTVVAGDGSQPSQQVEPMSSPSLRGKRSLRAPLPKSALSSPNVNSPNLRDVSGSPESKVSVTVTSPTCALMVQEEGRPQRETRSRQLTDSQESNQSTSKRGRKRKVDDVVKSPSAQLITNFLQKGAKKKKVENAETTEETNNSEDKPKDAPIAEAPATSVPCLPRIAEVNDDGTIIRPALFDGGSLRPYQVEGLNWLKVLFENGVNGILADEMGLGKTVQVIAVITQIITMGAKGPFLIVAPLSTLPNWRSEFKRFASLLPLVFYHGAKGERASIRRQLRKMHRVECYTIMPVVITSYEMAIVDQTYLAHMEWTYLIVDEGHRLKNMECRLIRSLKTYNTAHRLLLTGTPLQNNLRELWSLLNFLIPEIFDDLGSFEMWFDIEVISDDSANQAIIEQEKKSNILSMLHQILTPFMLRRVKSDVDLKIPPKKELLVYAPLTEVQEEFYRLTVDKTILKKINEQENKEEPVELSETGRVKRRSVKKVDYRLMMESKKDSESPINKRKDEEELDAWVEAIIEQSKAAPKEEKKKKQSELNIQLQNIMMQLRKCCNHPYLLQYPLDENGEYKIDESLVTVSGKMMILDKLLIELRNRGHKVLLFSQMTKMLNIIEEFCIMRQYTYCRLDGSTSLQDRQEGMQMFNTDPKMFLFLLSTRAGGLGINLTSADTVIIYDSDWNPQNDLQAQDRCHRIGQTKPVMIYRLVTANTIDQRIVERAAAKRKLEKMIIQKGKFKSGIHSLQKETKAMNPEELLELLKAKDHSGTVRKGKFDCVLSKEDLDALMDRSDMWKDLKDLLAGKKKDQTKSDESVLKTTVEESSHLFKMIDYDGGGSTKVASNTKAAS